MQGAIQVLCSLLLYMNTQFELSCSVLLFFIISTSAIDCLESLVSDNDLLCVQYDIEPYC